MIINIKDIEPPVKTFKFAIGDEVRCICAENMETYGLTSNMEEFLTTGGIYIVEDVDPDSGTILVGPKFGDRHIWAYQKRFEHYL